MNHKKCAYYKCNKTSRNRAMFDFPINHQERLNLWIQNSGNILLNSLSNDELKNRSICADHFPRNSIYHGVLKARLLGLAVPFPFKRNKSMSNGHHMEIDEPLLNVKRPKKYYTRKIRDPASSSSSPAEYSGSSPSLSYVHHGIYLKASPKQNAVNESQCMLPKDELTDPLSCNEQTETESDALENAESNHVNHNEMQTTTTPNNVNPPESINDLFTTFKSVFLEQSNAEAPMFPGIRCELLGDHLTDLLSDEEIESRPELLESADSNHLKNNEMPTSQKNGNPPQSVNDLFTTLKSDLFSNAEASMVTGSQRELPKDNLTDPLSDEQIKSEPEESADQNHLNKIEMQTPQRSDKQIESGPELLKSADSNRLNSKEVPAPQTNDTPHQSVNADHFAVTKSDFLSIAKSNAESMRILASTTKMQAEAAMLFAKAANKIADALYFLSEKK